MELLRLKEAMCNAPHAQQLATQFAADAQEISHLLREFNTSCSYVYQAQEGLANAYMRMSEISRLIGGKSLTVQPKNADFENVCLQFSSFLEEMSGMHRAEAEELKSALFLPAHKLPSQPGLQLVDNSTNDEEGGNTCRIQFADLPATERHREACEREVHASLGRYMHLTRRCGPKEHDDAVLELSRHRRMFQKASVIYHARLNAAHFEREMVPLNAFYGFLNTLRNHCKRINEVVGQPSLGQFAEVIKSQFDCRQVQSTQATEEFLNTLTNIQSQSLALFAPEPLFAKSDRSYLRTPDTNLLSKSGYLYMRVKKTFGFDWNEVYCFTQGGNLLYQQKGDLGAGVLVNLNGKGVFAEPVDIDDRRYTFQIVSAAGKREKKSQQEASSFLNSLFATDTQPQTQTVVLQAENSTDRDEWIQTISNVIVNTSSFANKGLQPPEPNSTEPLPFVLVPRTRFPPESASGGSGEELGEEEMESELDRALRASLTAPSAWISQSPPIHFELIPVDATVSPPSSSAQAASADGDGEGSSTTEKPVDADVFLSFIGSMPLPRFHANPIAVGEFAKYLLTKRAEAKPSNQKCVARFTPDTLFFLESSSESQQSTVLSNFKLAQIVHCVEINAPDNKPESQRKLLVLITSEPHSAQWIDLTSGGLHICHLFETSNPAEFAERVLNLQLVRLAALNEEGESPEKARIMENILRSSEWNSSSVVGRSPLRQVPEVTQAKTTAEVPSKKEEKDAAPIYGDGMSCPKASDDEAVLVDLEPKPDECGE
ncbi:unnamed protein product [Hymenolepis diminuta]|uniref:PH domain-containing protein n=1 Tax=Hymenolepis diminuta TaxID=6216 RepID=A0A564Z461_HYMDI|nr:unnamed protein product [Hymenolepis diminuta]